MKNRAVKLFLGKLVFDRARLPRTSYRWQTYHTQSGKLRRHRVERRPVFYDRSSTPQQKHYGINYQKGHVRLRHLNQLDLRTLTNHDAAKVRPFAAAATKEYIIAITRAIKETRQDIVTQIDRLYAKKLHQPRPSDDGDPRNEPHSS